MQINEFRSYHINTKTCLAKFQFVGTLKQYFNIPIEWTTDVNAACYGEYVAGSGKGLAGVAYFTVGTGIGGGALFNGTFVEGFSHPEMGMLIKRHPKDNFQETVLPPRLFRGDGSRTSD